MKVQWIGLTDHFLSRVSGMVGGRAYRETTMVDTTNESMISVLGFGQEPDDEFYFKGPLYAHAGSFDGEPYRVYGRSYSLGGAMAFNYANWLARPPSTSEWPYTIGFHEVRTTCTQINGVAALKFAYLDDEGRSVVFWAEANSPHRILARTQTDRIKGDDFRRDYSYSLEPVRIDTILFSRIGADLRFRVIECETKPQGGFRLALEVENGTSDPKIDEIDLAIGEGYKFYDNGNAYISSNVRITLAPGHQEFDGGSVTYRDVNRVGIIDSGDSLSINLDPGIAFLFWDTWSTSHPVVTPLEQELVVSC